MLSLDELVPPAVLREEEEVFVGESDFAMGLGGHEA
jgi:hypothetical protein